MPIISLLWSWGITYNREGYKAEIRTFFFVASFAPLCPTLPHLGQIAANRAN